MLQNSFPIWEDFNMKAGRMHAALRLVVICSFCLEFFKVLECALKKAVWRRVCERSVQLRIGIEP